MLRLRSEDRYALLTAPLSMTGDMAESGAFTASTFGVSASGGEARYWPARAGVITKRPLGDFFLLSVFSWA